VERRLPDTLRIRVTERTPVVSVRLPGRLRPGGGVELASYYLDAEGAVMDLQPTAFESLRRIVAGRQLPRLVGVNGKVIVSGRKVESPGVQSALRLIEAFRASQMYARVKIRTVDLSLGDSLEVTTDRGSRVRFGLDQIEEQMSRWRLAHQYALQHGREIGTLDLSVQNNAPLRWLPTPAIGPAVSQVNRRSL
jgi:cell division septal protein FtsQ